MLPCQLSVYLKLPVDILRRRKSRTITCPYLKVCIRRKRYNRKDRYDNDNDKQLYYSESPGRPIALMHTITILPFSSRS